MTSAYDEEVISGNQKDYLQLSDVKQAANREGSSGTISSEAAAATPVQPTCSVSMGNNILISEKREESNCLHACFVAVAVSLELL